MQAYIDGLPVFTESEFGYGWSDGACGIMLGVLGLSAPVVNQLVAKGATKISDRVITVSGGGGRRDEIASARERERETERERERERERNSG